MNPQTFRLQNFMRLDGKVVNGKANRWQKVDGCVSSLQKYPQINTSSAYYCLLVLTCMGNFRPYSENDMMHYVHKIYSQIEQRHGVSLFHRIFLFILKESGCCIADNNHTLWRLPRFVSYSSYQKSLAIPPQGISTYEDPPQRNVAPSV